MKLMDRGLKVRRDKGRSVQTDLASEWVTISALHKIGKPKACKVFAMS